MVEAQEVGAVRRIRRQPLAVERLPGRHLREGAASAPATRAAAPAHDAARPWRSLATTASRSSRPGSNEQHAVLPAHAHGEAEGQAEDQR